jgi:hypothetical protein
VIACTAACETQQWLDDPAHKIRTWTRVPNHTNAATNHLNQTRNPQ